MSELTETYLAQYEERVEKEQFDDAESMLQKAISGDMSNPEIYYTYADLCCRKFMKDKKQEHLINCRNFLEIIEHYLVENYKDVRKLLRRLDRSIYSRSMNDHYG